MHLANSHRAITHFVVAVTTAAIVFYSEQALASVAEDLDLLPQIISSGA